jgi:hypothetical protein
MLAVMRSHLVLLLLFAFFVSLVFAVIAKDDAGEQIRLGSLMFAGFLVAALVLGWLMYPLPM